MAQVFVIVGAELEEKLSPSLNIIKKVCYGALMNVWDVPDWDLAFTAVQAIESHNEADFQIEIRYTAGEDEYNRGRPFDPTEEEKEELKNAILLGSRANGQVVGLQKWTFFKSTSFSLWSKGYYDSPFFTTLT